MKQNTIKNSFIIEGIRQSDGRNTFIKFLPCDSGVYIRYKSFTEPMSPYLINNDEKRFTNSIIVNGEIITMVEHVFSAINGLGINNIIVEFGSNEAPFFANAKVFADQLYKNIKSIKTKKRLDSTIKNNFDLEDTEGCICKFTPSNDFRVNITVDFNNIIGVQNYSYSFLKNNYIEDISYARSILLFEIRDENNPWIDFKKHFDKFPFTLPTDPKESPYITYNKNRFITPLRDKLEPVKHKLLDFIGDIIFLGSIPLGEFKLYKPGHRFNRQIVNKMWFGIPDFDERHFEYFLKKVPEMNILSECVENNIVHKNEDVLSHTKQVFKKSLNLIREYKISFKNAEMLKFLLAIFLHDYGKHFTLEIGPNGNTSCDGHEQISVQKISEASILDRFNLSVFDKNWIQSFIKNHAELHKIFNATDSELDYLLQDFRRKFKDSYLENLIFSITDIENSYLKQSNVKEYIRRIGFLRRQIKNLQAT